MSPFHGRSYNEILIKNKNCEIKFNIKELGYGVSDQGKLQLQTENLMEKLLAIDLLTKMLAKDPKARISGRECLEHPWIVCGGSDEQVDRPNPGMLSSAQQNMKRFQEEYINLKFRMFLNNQLL